MILTVPKVQPGPVSHTHCTPFRFREPSSYNSIFWLLHGSRIWKYRSSMPGIASIDWSNSYEGTYIQMKMTRPVRVFWEPIYENRPLIAIASSGGCTNLISYQYGQGRRESEAKILENFYLLCWCHWLKPIYLFYWEISATTAHDIGKRAISSEWVMPVCTWIFIAHNIVSTVDVTNTGWWRKDSLTQVRKSACGWYGSVDSTK